MTYLNIRLFNNSMFSFCRRRGIEDSRNSDPEVVYGSVTRSAFRRLGEDRGANVLNVLLSKRSEQSLKLDHIFTKSTY